MVCLYSKTEILLFIGQISEPLQLNVIKIIYRSKTMYNLIHLFYKKYIYYYLIKFVNSIVSKYFK